MSGLGGAEKTHKVHISCSNAARSKSVMLHRFIAQLNIPKYIINNVFIIENPLQAKIVFRKLNTSQSIQSKILTWLTQKSQGQFVEFALHLKIHDLDRMGHNFILSYNIDDLGNGSQENDKLAKDIPKIIATAFDDHNNITVLPYS